MSKISITRSLKSPHPTSEEGVIAELKRCLSLHFSNFEITKTKEKENYLTCKVKTRLLSPVVSIKGFIFIQLQNSEATVAFDGQIKPNAWLWAPALFGFVFPLVWAWLVFLYFKQKMRSRQALNIVFKNMKLDAQPQFVVESKSKSVS